MNLQFISDNRGFHTGVFIPIEDWEVLKKKYKELQIEEKAISDIPEWHKKIIDQRLDALKRNPDNVLDFNKACDDIEKEL